MPGGFEVGISGGFFWNTQATAIPAEIDVTIRAKCNCRNAQTLRKIMNLTEIAQQAAEYRQKLAKTVYVAEGHIVINVGDEYRIEKD